MHEAGVAVMQENVLKFMVSSFFLSFFSRHLCSKLICNDSMGEGNAESHSYLSQANFSFAICVLGNIGN